VRAANYAALLALSSFPACFSHYREQNPTQIVKCCQIEVDIISFRRECGDTSITLPRVCPATKVILVVLKSHPARVGLFFNAPIGPDLLVTREQARRLATRKSLATAEQITRDGTEERGGLPFILKAAAHDDRRRGAGVGQVPVDDAVHP
jgi:hypothetical protein